MGWYPLEAATPYSPAPSDKLAAVSNVWKAPLPHNAAMAAGDQVLFNHIGPWSGEDESQLIHGMEQRLLPALQWDSSVVTVHWAVNSRDKEFYTGALRQRRGHWVHWSSGGRELPSVGSEN